jgi:hypothetical protein
MSDLRYLSGTRPNFIDRLVALNPMIFENVTQTLIQLFFVSFKRHSISNSAKRNLPTMLTDLLGINQFQKILYRIKHLFLLAISLPPLTFLLLNPRVTLRATLPTRKVLAHNAKTWI